MQTTTAPTGLQIRATHRTLRQQREAMRQDAHPFVGAALDYADESEGDPARYAAQAALRELAESWRDHVAEGHDPADLVRQDLIAAARLLLEAARELAPAVCGRVLSGETITVQDHEEEVYEVQSLPTGTTVGYCVHDSFADLLATLASEG